MARALYRSYRPKKLSEAVGQEHITDSLARALKKGTISHAYLFTGPRGVGKTSIARILAHEINGLPYEDDTNHLDIIEIDAASNRRIDEIRDLREKVHIAPAAAKYKVYIIDEVHMLTKEAFNALLKTLEEPPAHAVFILATTEAHKLPETIISRTQRFAFKPAEQGQVTAHLRHIANQEKIDIEDTALELIAKHGEGSFRDSISLLDQVRSSSDKVTLKDVQASLGIAPIEVIESLMTATRNHDSLEVASILREIGERGFEAAQVARQFAKRLREEVVNGQSTLPHDVALHLLTKLIEVPASSDPHSYLEIALLDAALAGSQPQPPVTTPASPKVMHQEVTIDKPVVTEPHPSSLRKTEKPEPPKPADSTDMLDAAAWEHVLAAIKQKYNTLYSILRAASPTFSPGCITLECAYTFNQKRLKEGRNRQVIIDTIKAVTGQDIQIECTVSKAGKAHSAPLPPLPSAEDEKIHIIKAEPVTKSAAVENISNIFGGAELLES